MIYMAIEYDEPSTNKHVKGYIRFQDNFPGSWFTGFDKYLREELHVTSRLDIYTLNIQTTSDSIGKDPVGYTNLDAYFNEAIRSEKYFPSSEINDNMRRKWAELHKDLYNCNTV